MVTFKEVWDKLYYTQHTLLSNMRQLPTWAHKAPERENRNNCGEQKNK